ncbi:hypothetical protein LUPAC07_05764 [Micromonospora noduli]|nr:hypothetical protein LUPAC07_05764 [Micromonospora noduli]
MSAHRQHPDFLKRESILRHRVGRPVSVRRPGQPAGPGSDQANEIWSPVTLMFFGGSGLVAGPAFTEPSSIENLVV